MPNRGGVAWVDDSACTLPVPLILCFCFLWGQPAALYSTLALPGSCLFVVVWWCLVQMWTEYKLLA